MNSNHSKKTAPRPAPPFKTIIALATVYALCVTGPGLSSARAATDTWDASGNGGVSTDGSGTWSTSGTNWNNGGTDFGWPTGDDAVIGNNNGAAGTITVSGGVSVDSITFNPASSGNYTVTGSIITMTGSNITVNSSAEIDSVVTGGAGLAVSGTGVLTLGGVDTYTGATLINGGSTLQIGGAGQLGSGSYAGSISIATSGTLNYGSSASQTLSGVISGGGGVIDSGAGTLTLNNANTYTGNTVVSSGTTNVTGSISSSSPIIIGSNGSTGATLQIALPGTVNLASVTTASGATGSELILNESTNGTLNMTGPVTLNSALTIAKVNNGSFAVFQPTGITGTGAGAGNDSLLFSNLGGSTLYIIANSGTYNYGGNVHFLTANGQSYVLQGGNSPFSSTASVTLDSGALVQNNSTGTNFAFDALNGAGTWNTFNGTTSTLTMGSAGGSGTFSGIIENTAGTTNVVKTGAGTETLIGAGIIYTGSTVVNGGTLALQNYTGAVPTSFASNVTVNSGGVLDLVNTNAAFASRIGFTPTISGSGVLEATGSGYIASYGVNTVTVTGGVNVLAGTLGNDGGGGTGAFGTCTAPLSISAGAVFDLRGGVSQFDALTGAGSVIDSYNGTTLTIGAANGSGTFSGVIQNGGNAGDPTSGNGGALALTKVGTGTETLTGTNTFSGATSVKGGELSVSNIGSYASPTVAISTSSTFAVNVAAGTQTVSHSTAITGTGTLLVNGPGTWMVGANGGAHVSFNMSAGGLVDIEGGVIQNNFNNNSWVSNLASVNIASGATLDLFAENGQMDALTGGGTLQNGYAPNGLKIATIGVSNGSGAFGGVISSTGGNLAVVKNGTGTETLTGANTYTGSTTINAGALQIGNGGATGSISSSTAVSGSTGATLAFNESGALPFSNAISGGVGVTQLGTGTVTLTGANSYTGGTTISSGTLTIGGAGQLGSGGSYSGGISDSGALIFNSSANQTLGGAISGAGTVAMSGASTLTINAASPSFSGGFTITSGTVIAGNASAFGTGTLTLSGGAITAGSVLTFTNPIFVKANTTTNLRGNSGGGSYPIFSGAITGSGTILNNGAGSSNAFINGDISGFTGTIDFTNGAGGDNFQFAGTVAGGNYSGQNVNFVGSGSGGGNALFFDTAGIVQMGSLSGAGGNISSIAAVTLQIGALNSSPGAYAGTISAGGGISLTKVGTGTLTLSGANANTGPTAINAGIINYQNATAFGKNSAITVSNGATAQVQGGIASTGVTNLTISGTGAAGTTGALENVIGTNSASMPIILGTNSTISSDAGALTLSGGVTGAFNLTLASQSSGNGALTFSTGIVNNGGTITNNGAGTGAVTISSAIGSNVTGVTENSSGSALTLSGANSYTGGTTLTAGQININNANALGAVTSGLVINSGTIDDTSGSITVAGNAETWAGSFTFNGSNALNTGTGAITLTTSPTITVNGANALTVGGVIAGSGLGITKSGAGTLILGGANTFNGGLLIRNGTVTLGVSNALGSNGVTLGMSGDSGPTLNFGGFSPTVTSLTVGSNVTNAKILANTSWGPPVVSGTVTLNSPLQIAATAGNLQGFENDGKITGNGGGSGHDTLIFNNPVSSGNYYWQMGSATSDFLGNIHIEGGQLGLQGFFAGTNQIIPDSSMVIIDTGASMIWNNFSYTVNETIDGLSGGGALTVNTANAHLNLTIGSSNPDNNGNRNYSGVLSNLNSFTKTGTGTQVFSGADTYACSTVINAGTLQIGAGAATGSIASTTGVSGSAGGTLAFDLSGAATFAPTISGGVGVLQEGTGSLTLTGASNSYTGGTTITSGTLIANADGNLGGASSGVTFAGAGTLRSGSTATLVSTRGVTLNSGITGTFDTNGNNLTVNGVINGATGALTKIGSGNLILGGADNYGGATTINNGTIRVNNSLSNSAVTVNNGGGLGGTGTVGSAVTVNGGGAINLVDGTIGTLTLSNGLTIGNNSTASILNFEGNTSFDLLNDTAGLTISGSATINITALGGALTPGTYNLITFNSLVGSMGNLTLGSTIVNGKNLSLVSTGTSEELLVAGAAAYWKAANGTSWSASGPTNWTADAAGTSATTAPTSNVDVYFNANGVSGPLTTSLGANFDINSLNFNATATGSVTVSDGTFGLTIENGLTAAAGTGAHTISVTGVTVNNSQVWANNSANLLTVASPVAGAAAASGTTVLTMSGTGSGNTLLGGAITDGTAGGQLALLINGAGGATIFSANNSYSGGTTISSGTLQVGTGGTAGTLGSGAVADNGALIFNRSDSPTVSTAIGGSGSLTQAGSGTLILTGSNTYSGGSTISAGTLQLGNGVSSNGYVAGNITDNATLAFANATAQTYSGAVSGSGAVIASGSGTLTLVGANTYTGSTTVSSGTTNATGSISSSSPVVIGSNGSTGATLEIAMPATVNFASLTTASGAAGAALILNPLSTTFLNVTGNTTLNSPLTITKLNNGGSWAALGLDGISGTGGGTGHDSLVFSDLGGIQMYVQANAGTYNYSGNVHFLTDFGAQYIIQGSNFFASTASVTLDSGAAVNFNSNGTNFAFDALNGSGSWGGGSSTLTMGSAGGSGTFSGAIGGSILVAKTGTGTEVFTGANTYTGSTSVYNGTLQIGNGGTLGSISTSSAISGSAGGTLAYDLSTSGTISNTISGGIGVTQAGSGTLTIPSSGITYTGTTSVNSGTVIVAGGISGNAVTNGGTLIASGVIGGNVAMAGGLLGGSGTIGGSVTVGNNLGATSSSIIYPSAGAATTGTTTLSILGSLTLNNDAAFKFTLNSSGPFTAGLGTSDYLSVNGTLTIQPNAVFTGLDAGNTVLTPGEQFLVAYATGGIFGRFNNVPEDGWIQIGQNTFSVDYDAYDVSGQNDGLLLTVVAVPEPGTWATILLGFGMLVGLQRRRRRS